MSDLRIRKISPLSRSQVPQLKILQDRMLEWLVDRAVAQPG